jgi:TolB-like protein/Tfp pilus assembly protein PilF
MFTDIVGYTAVMARDEEAGRRARDRHAAVVRSLVERCHGRWIEATGDESLSSFPSALDAVSCALAVQEALRNDPELRLRIGIHQGDVTFEGDRVSGDGVNVAARIRPLAEPRGVCVSDEVQHSLRGRTDLEFASLGERELKNVGRPVAVYAVGRPGTIAVGRLAAVGRARRWRGYATAALALALLAGTAWWATDRWVASPGPIRSIAVLPLENLSGDPEQEYFVGGMHEALISSLARIGTGLRVISRTSVIQGDLEGKSIAEIASQLGVDAVIEGSALREGDQVRVTVQLIDARRDDHLWAKSYDREFSSALALTREISRSVAGQIRLVLSPERERMLADARPVDPQALDLYLSGAQHLSRVTVPDGRRAIELFEASIAADPSFARAHEGLARAYWFLMEDLWAISPDEALPKVREAASRALELDGTLAEAHAFLALWHWIMEFDWAEAEASFSRALALEPMNADVMNIFSYFLQCSGRIQEGLRLMEQAVTADPANLVTRADFAWRLYRARRFARVVEEADQIVERDPGFARAYDLLGASYWILGDLETAHNAYRQYDKLSGRPPWYLEAADRGYEQGGFKGSMKERLAAIREHDDGSISHGVRAAIACVAEEPEEALFELNHAVRRRNPSILMMGTWPLYDCVRSDPRFQDLLRKINWPGLEG